MMYYGSEIDESLIMSQHRIDPEITNTIVKLYDELNLLKSMFETPETFITNFFIDLKAEIDLAFTKQLILDSNNKNMFRLNETYTQMIERIDLFEKECLLNQTTNTFNNDIVLELNDSIELVTSKITNLYRHASENELSRSGKKFQINHMNILHKNLYIDLFYPNDDDSNASLNEVDELEQEISDLIHEQMFKIEKILFMNKTIMFLEKTKPKDKHLANDLTVGKLVFITNEYIGKRCRSIIKRETYLHKKITKDIIRCYYLIKKIKKHSLLNTNENIIEIHDSFQSYDINAIKLSFNSRLAHLESGKLLNSLNTLQEVRLDNNQLMAFDPNLLNGLNNLSAVYLSHNLFTSIDSASFVGLTSLKSIYLDNNRITSLSGSLFSGLHNLKEIYLDNNRLTHLDDSSVFKGLTNLRAICLSNNYISTLDKRIFQGLTSLQEIYLSNNRISHLDKNLFVGLRNLRTISLAHNLLKTIDPFIFITLNRLKTVYLHHNRFTTPDKLELYLDDSVEFISFRMSSIHNDIKLVHKPNILNN